ncbi:MAG: hypothetical protein P1V20_16770 [Verrucomicrobiales bacterium]|nr:hypothetical protein [Verrucomicrobiales bacterium]
MKPQNIESILDELPPDIREILTRYAIQEEEDIDTLIKKWITATAERLALPTATSSPEKEEGAA